MNEAAVLDALHKRYSAPEWAFLRHVPAANGGWQRRCDALAINCYPSRGCETHGFEVKISKGDLKRELADPDKAEELAQYCHYWWIVAPKDLAVPVDELPANWGLIAVDEASSAVVKKAAKLKPKPPTREFVAALARKVATYVNDPDEMQRAVALAVKKDRAEQRERDAGIAAGWRKRAEKAEQALDAFKQGFGTNVGRCWDDATAREQARRLGSIFKAVEMADPREASRRCSDVANVLSQVLRDVESACARLHALPPVIDTASVDRPA